MNNNPTPQPLTEEDLNQIRSRARGICYDGIAGARIIQLLGQIDSLKSQLQSEKEKSKNYSDSFDTAEATHKACPTGEELHKVWCRGSYVWAAVSDAEKLRWQQLENIFATLQRCAEKAQFAKFASDQAQELAVKELTTLKQKVGVIVDAVKYFSGHGLTKKSRGIVEKALTIAREIGIDTNNKQSDEKP